MAESQKTQTEAVFTYLKAGMSKCRGITDKQAVEMFGAYRLSGIIFNLRKRLQNTEYDIINVWHTGTNRYGGSSRYVEYVMVKK